MIGLGQTRVCKDLSLSFFSIPADFAGPCLETPLLLGLLIGALVLVFWQTFSKVLSIVTWYSEYTYFWEFWTAAAQGVAATCEEEEEEEEQEEEEKKKGAG